LIPTPTKPVDPKWRNWRIDGLAYWPPTPGVSRVKGEAIATEADLEKWDRQYGMIDVSAMLLPLDWAGYKCWHPHLTDPEQVAVMKQRVHSLNERSIIGLWNGGWAVAPYAPQWDPWGMEMIARPLSPTFVNELDGTYTSPYTEFMVGSWFANIRDLGLHGIRFDTVIPWKPSANPYLGETWTADTPGAGSRVYGTQALFRQRELVKRLYRAFQYHGQPGVLWLGIAGPPIMACESFITIHEVAEGVYMNAATIKEAYPQDKVRPWMTSGAYGFVEINSLKGKPLRSINRVGPLLVADASPRLSGRDTFNEDGYEPRSDHGVPAHRIWEAWSWIDRGTSQWHPHWNNQHVLKSRAEGGGEHYASLHLQPGRRLLLIVANYERRPLDVQLEFDLAELGFDSATTIVAVDAITRDSVPMQGGSLALTLLSENFRLLKIGPRHEVTGRPLDPEHPDPLP
jgi:hypothetical protein